MPDHLHLVVQGMSESSDTKSAADRFKAQAGIWLERNRPGASIQEGYYDHIIRPTDDFRRQLFYILSNPVRAGLVEDPFRYPFSGSIGYNLRELIFDQAFNG